MDIVYDNKDLLFMPSVLPQLLNIKASEFTNKIIPLEDISKELFYF